MLTFGPIPSRRLGRSLGVNNIPPKICTYSCTYCQQGYSSKVQIERQAFFKPEEIRDAVQEQIDRATAAGDNIDYISFVPDGEPTLDINLGREINLLKPLSIPIAVITNASLLWKADVRAELARADWVSVKIDTVDEQIWRKVDHPHRGLSLPLIKEGILAFASEYQGKLYTETMLVQGLNDKAEGLDITARFVAQVKPEVSYILIPTRPPADRKIKPPDEITVNIAYQIYSRYIDKVEYLIGHEGDSFTYTGNLERDLLRITSVHPMRESAVKELLEKAGQEWSAVEQLIADGKLIELDFDGSKFYMRKLFDTYKR